MKQGCPKCRKNHGDRPCLARQNVCFHCYKPGHEFWECTSQDQFLTAKPQHQGRVFTLNIRETTQSEGLIEGKSKVYSRTLTVMYDFGTTNSFVSHDCINRLKFVMSKLPYVMLVSKFTNKPSRTSQVYLKCHFQIDGGSFKADLIFLSLPSLDLVLGIDWPLANHVMLSCFERSVTSSLCLLRL